MKNLNKWKKKNLKKKWKKCKERQGKKKNNLKGKWKKEGEREN